MTTGGTPGRYAVVGVDDSPHAQAALRWAVEWAQLTGARVRAVAVWARQEPVLSGPEMGAAALLHGTLTDDELQAGAEQRLAAAVGLLPAGTDAIVDRTVVPGPAATVLLDEARSAELLVLGNAGHGALAAAILGSVAQRCTHHATCPVVLVPDPQQAHD